MDSAGGWDTAGRLSGNFGRTMSERKGRQSPPPERSFGPIADAYDRARPSYPEEAVAWMTGSGTSVVLELGAGTGKLTEVIHEAGHDVLATDPLPEMLTRLARHVPVKHVVASAEHIPLRSRSVDLVVAGQSFHWFDHDTALPEIARVLRPGGILALVWNTYDEGIPWVRRLKELLSPETHEERAMPLMTTPYFGFVEKKQFRFWQPHTAATLADLTRSVSHVATMSESDRAGCAGQGRQAVRRVRPRSRRHAAALGDPVLPGRRTTPGAAARAAAADPAGNHAEGEQPVTDARDTADGKRPPEDPGTQLIDFR